MPSPDAVPGRVSETSIRQFASAESYERGQAYAAQGAVSALVCRGTSKVAARRGNATRGGDRCNW